MKNNPYSKVKENAIFTATPEELTLMLYEGALKFANQAVIFIEKKDFYNANLKIQKVKDILRELKFTLDMKYEISSQLEQIYDYLLRRITQANIKKDVDIMEEVIKFLRQLRDTWKEAIKIVKSSVPAPGAPDKEHKRRQRQETIS